ncbi:hypothetical protein V7S43_010090 [Phytophthora oleae]|uniref:Ubiquitin-like protease family profile domain-containing protein n=1 Tax=Phytophthora oleae TaxID=2107226 RepID=A0ABD3FDT7_9STRA
MTITEAYPHKHIAGLPDQPDFEYAMLYRATPLTWLTDADDSVLNDDVRDRVLVQLRETGVDTVLLPLNFKNAHWCCVVVKVGSKRIYYYDPLNIAPYMNAAKAVATNLKIAGLDKFDVIRQNNPIQFDTYSCGVYVCWMFIRQVVPGPALDMSAATSCSTTY